MLTADEIKTIPLFSALEAPELEHLARTCEDIHLRAGEFAIPEGGERAFFAVISGKIEVIKQIDGVERRLDGAFRARFSAKCRLPWARPFRVAIARQKSRASCGWTCSAITHWPPQARNSPPKSARWRENASAACRA
jgi:hypothetical protein